MQEVVQEQALLERPTVVASPWRVAWRRLRRKRLAMIALTTIVVFYLVGLLAPVIAPYGYRDQDLNHTLETPSWSHPF